VFSLSSVLGDIAVLIGTTIVYMIMLFVVEWLKNKRGLSGIFRENRVRYVPKAMDEDVKREEYEVEKSDNKTYAIKVDKLRKVYALGGGKHKVAVDRVSFGVRNGECFALLGVNGAGKTTTFKILSGDYIQTSGNAYINGYSIPGQMNEARKDIGYCPQFDALLENLTAKEHLELYATIKGIPKKYVCLFCLMLFLT
jgi:ATP-binding cassette subfamily A (ABC1) protein 3